MKISKNLKKYAPLAALVLAVIVIILVIISINACNVRDDLSLKLGEYKATVELVEKEKVQLEASIAAKEKIILDKNTEIGNIKKETEKKEKVIQDLDTELAGVHKEIDTATTDSNRVLLFKKEIKIWEGMFTQAQLIIGDKNKEIDAWSTKFDALKVIADGNKKGWDNAEKQASTCEAARSALEKRLKKARFFSNVKTVAVVAAVGYLAYNLLKK